MAKNISQRAAFLLSPVDDEIDDSYALPTVKNFPGYLMVAALLWISPAFDLKADPSSAIGALKAQLQKACENHDLDAIRKCYDVDGTPQFLQDREMNTWKHYFNVDGTNHQFVFTGVSYISLEQAKADKYMNQKAVALMTAPENINGVTYEPNLKVIGFIAPNFKDKEDSSEGATMANVGIASDGSAKLVMSRPIQ